MNHPHGLARTLAVFREEAKILRRNGHNVQADTIERMAASVEVEAAAYLEWISEDRAMLRAGRGHDFFKSRREAWAADGNAEKRGRVWFYRAVCVERRKLPSIERAEQARRARGQE